ncbi:hypothetical protein PhCBS80983_g03502 [Powellomyces hirtus]|uniref:Reelin domain-containing protein n=1 Tax=Powellomyces hirtus TaxID=109895 RepID=A0A507E443_9FUNG|nr:hypothetical protein PhCBS80983_g03502 [Powellomyces hirtus]
MPSLARFLSLSVLLAGAAHALPGGAPKCAINPGVISAAHSAPSAAGFTLTSSSTTYTAGQKISVTIAGTTNQVAGVLMYATAGTESDAQLAPNSAKAHVGVFNVPTGFRAQTAAVCDGATIKNDAPESTITHANPSEKGQSVTFEWTAPAAASGPITFNAAVASGSPGKPWQVLDIVTLQPAGGASPDAGGAAPSASVPAIAFPAGGIETVAIDANAPAATQPGMPKRKCKNKKNKHDMPKETGMPMPEMPKETGMPKPEEPKDTGMPMPEMSKETVMPEMAKETAMPMPTDSPVVPVSYPAENKSDVEIASGTAEAVPSATASEALPIVTETGGSAPTDVPIFSGSSPSTVARWASMAGVMVASGFFLLA